MHNLLPPQFAGDLQFRENLTNYLLDGSLTASGKGEILENYNKVIQAVGDEFFANKEKILSGTYERKVKETTSVFTAPRSLDFMSGSPKILGIEQIDVDPPYTQALNEFNNTRADAGCVNCTTVQTAP